MGELTNCQINPSQKEDLSREAEWLFAPWLDLNQETMLKILVLESLNPIPLWTFPYEKRKLLTGR